MLLKMVMRDAAGAVVSGTPTVTADGVALTPTGTSALWQVDAPLGSLVSATLDGALPLDVMMPLIDPTTLPTDADVQAAAQAAIVAEAVSTFNATTDPVEVGNIAEVQAGLATTGEAATAVATLNDFDPATDVVAHVTLVDTTTTNTDMRGTDSAMLAASYTAPPTAAQNADAVWDEAVADHVTSGTFGRFLQRVYRYFFNKTLHTNTSMVVYADDGTTSDAVMAVSGDTSSVTKGAAS